MIPRAVASRKWPGQANLEVAQVWLRRGEWKSECVLDDKPATGITPFLTPPGTVTGNPYRLKANEGKSFQGSIVLGMGFVLEPDEAQRLIERDPRNKDVLFPYLNGEDLNSRPDQSPSRWVINFFDWPIEKGRDYPDCFRIIEEKVKPEREKNKRKERREKWWQYAEKCPALYRTIAGMERVLVRSRVAELHSIGVVPSRQVLNERLAVFAFDGLAWLTLLQTTIHEVWVRHYGSTLRTDLMYTPSDCFETFPFLLAAQHSSLATIGEAYHAHRRQIMQSRQEGLTKTYNRFHDRSETAEDIVKLRGLHVELDRAVAAAYGWTDLDLGHGFHATKQGLRFTLSDPARREVLARLLKLNHERYAEEVRQGLHDKKQAKKPRTTRNTQKKKKESEAELF